MSDTQGPKPARNPNQKVEPPVEIPDEEKPRRVRPQDALGNPIEPPKGKDREAPVTLVDADTDDVIWQSDLIPMPQNIGRQLMFDMYYDGNRVHHMYFIDRIDADARKVFVTLQKVLHNDEVIYPAE